MEPDIVMNVLSTLLGAMFGGGIGSAGTYKVLASRQQRAESDIQVLFKTNKHISDDMTSIKQDVARVRGYIEAVHNQVINGKGD